jgi:cell division protein FtsB
MLPMSAGSHKTSAIPRPKNPVHPRAGGGGTADDSRFSDFTLPIPREKQLVKGRGKRGFIALGAGVITAAVIAALFVLPVKAWLRQADDISAKQKELSALDDANAKLSNEVARLDTPEGIAEAARQEIGYVRRGEIRLTMLSEPSAPLTMPSGWPYDTLAKVVAVRRQAGSPTP